MVTIKEVKSRKELRQFIRFVNELYADNKYYTPSIEFDEMNMFDPKTNPSLDHCQFVNFLAYKNDKIVGRLCAIINNIANEHWNCKKLRFGWFDFIDDYEVSKALLDAAAEWGRKQGMTIMNGPVGFTDLDHQGLLLEGYEYVAPMASLYNFPYYVDHFERYGLTKEADWIEFQVFIPDKTPEKMERIAHVVMDRYKVRVDKIKNARELKKKYGMEYFDVIDAEYQKLYNVQPLTERQKKYYAEMFFPILNFDFITVVVNEKDEIVGVGVGMPDISKTLQEIRGRMLPFGWLKLLKALKAKKMDVFNLLLIAVRPDYQNKGINSLFFYDQVPYFQKYGIKYAETTAILEDNWKSMANFVSYFETKQHKRRRAYVKELKVEN